MCVCVCMCWTIESRRCEMFIVIPGSSVCTSHLFFEPENLFMETAKKDQRFRELYVQLVQMNSYSSLEFSHKEMPSVFLHFHMRITFANEEKE